MLSISEILACHHDAKLLDRAAAPVIPQADAPSARRRAVPFQPGLRVRMASEIDDEKRGVVRWTGDDRAIVEPA